MPAALSSPIIGGMHLAWFVAPPEVRGLAPLAAAKARGVGHVGSGELYVTLQKSRDE